MRQQTLFDSSRLSFDESIDLTAQSLNAYLSNYRHVAMGMT